MDERDDQDRRLRELIDAARPGVDDLADPDFALLADRVRQNPQLRRTLQRSQRLDSTIGDALHDLAVPAGSVDRLLAALTVAACDPLEPAAAGTPAAASISATDSRPLAKVPSDNAPTNVSPPPPRSLSHRWAGPGVLVAVTTAVLLMAYVLLRPTVYEMNPDEILSSGWFLSAEEKAAAHDPAAQNLVSEKTPPRRFPTAQTLSVQPTSWREITGLLDRRRGIAYQMRAAGARATLYVIEYEAGRNVPRLVGLSSGPPPAPLVKTQERAMSVWRSGDLVYVLVVEGGTAEYQSFVTPAGQLARHDRRFGANDQTFWPQAGRSLLPT
jgi:hypothetical protein